MKMQVLKEWWSELQRRQRKARKKRERGMTLVEIMVVVVIISLVMGVVGVAVFGTLQTAQKETALTQIRQIGNALDLYKLANRNYPSTGEGLNALKTPKSGAPIMADIPEDPWGNPYVYLFPGSHTPGGYDLMSYGPDGNNGGGDDVSNWGGIEGQSK